MDKITLTVVDERLTDGSVVTDLMMVGHDRGTKTVMRFNCVSRYDAAELINKLVLAFSDHVNVEIAWA